MNKRSLWLLMALALFSGPALANTWTDCAGNTSGNLVTVTGFELLCFDFTSTGVDSRVFMVGADSALICLDPALDTDGNDVTEILIRYCPKGQKPASNPQNECFALTTLPMSGTTGSPGVQDSCIEVGAGAYYIDITTLPAGGDNARVTIQGEGNK